MRIVSHTCSNTEIVCALGCAEQLVGVDSDSDHPPEAVGHLPRLGRDLELDIDRVLALQPDLVLTSLTVPGHERIVARLRDAGLPIVVVDPVDLDGVYASIGTIAEALGVLPRGRALVARMQAEMPPVQRSRRPSLLVEWWPKPVIAPARQSWVNDVLRLAGAVNPWSDRDGKSIELTDDDVRTAAPDAIVMSWCGVKEAKYRRDVVERRSGWQELNAVRGGRIFPVGEAFLGRPGPRLVEGYRALRRIVDAILVTS